MNGEKRHIESELVAVCKKAWLKVADVKILEAFEICKDCAQEVIDTNGHCDMEGKGHGGAKRVHTDPSYAALRKRLKIDEFAPK